MRVRSPGTEHAFTLVELLAVMAIVLILALALLPALTSLFTGGQMNTAVAGIAGTLEQARAYAMANNTYVYVGFQEVDVSNPTAADGRGRIVLAVVASRDGTRPVAAGSTGLTAANLAAITKMQRFDDVHLDDVSQTPLTNGLAMQNRPGAATQTVRDPATTHNVYLCGDTASVVTKFQWPLQGTAQNTFAKVIEFDPQGIARAQTGSAYDPSAQLCVEVPLVVSHGNAPAANATNQAAVQVDGITGAVHIYRP